jgi:hypothetical protein
MNRRGFIKMSIAVLATGIIAVLPVKAIAEKLSGVQPSPGRRPLFSRQIICRDYLNMPVIEDYVPGKPIRSLDLISEQDCSKCNFEQSCTCSGTRFNKRPDPNKPRTYFPELFSSEYQNEFVR